MQGEWVMFRLKPRGKERNENWILKKVNDEHAGSPTGLTDTYLTLGEDRPDDGRDRGGEEGAVRHSGESRNLDSAFTKEDEIPGVRRE